ncbi:MAG: hypothetical protein ABJQ29_14730 [Luteolibacter sp.]
MEKPATPPPLGTVHSVRVSALESESTWRLDGDTLWMRSQGQTDIPIPLAHITTVRLSYEPSRMQTRRYRCRLYSALGLSAMIQNDSYKGFADFEDRSDSYNSLVRLLILRIASINPQCIFKSGTSQLSWWAQAIMIAVIFGILILVSILLYTAIGALVIIKLLIIALFIPTLIRWFMKNRPHAFDPKDIPEGLLP